MSLADPGAIEEVLAVEDDVVPFDRADVLEQGCVDAFLGDSPRAQSPRDLLGLPIGFETGRSWPGVYNNVRINRRDMTRQCSGYYNRYQSIKNPFRLCLDATLKTVAYLRVSTGSQDLATQKLAILDFTQKRRFTVDEFIESKISSRKSPTERRIEEMLGTLQSGDRLLVSELSRLGRSLGQVLQIVATLIERKIRFIAIKEAIEVEGKQDLRTKVMIALFGLFAEVERDLISERTKEGLAAAKAKGKLLGRPKGALGTSRLDGKDVSKASIAKILGVSRSALYHFIQTRKIAPD